MKQPELQVIFDQETRTAVISVGSRTAVLPFPVFSQREANILGREYARNLCWLKPAH